MTGPADIDPVTKAALASFKEILVARYGAHLAASYLLGSRARGDHRPDSDADVAVFLDRVEDPLREQLALVEQGHPIVLETGVNIQPWVLVGGSLTDPAPRRASGLVDSIRREGVLL